MSFIKQLVFCLLSFIFLFISIPQVSANALSDWCKSVFIKKGVPTSINYLGNQNKNLTWKQKRIVKKYEKMRRLEDEKRLSHYEKKMLGQMQNEQPKDFEEYMQKTSDSKNADAKIEDPILPSNSKLVTIPESSYIFEKYNKYPGMQNFDIRQIKKAKTVYSKGVASFDCTKLVFTSAYLLPQKQHINSDAYLIYLDTSMTRKDRVVTANLRKKEVLPIVETGTNEIDNYVAKLLTIIDFSKDGDKIAFKEQISFQDDGIWQTNLMVYDFKTKTSRRVNEIREAIKYWWYVNKNIRLDDFRWDIYPVGWDELNSDKFIVYGYAWTTKDPIFLGTWSVDTLNGTSALMSLGSQNFKISTNGLFLKKSNFYSFP